MRRRPLRHRIAAPLLLLVAACLLTGCPPGFVPEGLPSGAMLTQESGPSLTYTATAPGTVYVRDQPADWIIFESPMDPGQTLAVDGEVNRLTLDGRPMKTKTILRPDATYQLFFQARGRE